MVIGSPRHVIGEWSRVWPVKGILIYFRNYLVITKSYWIPLTGQPRVSRYPCHSQVNCVRFMDSFLVFSTVFNKYGKCRKIFAQSEFSKDALNFEICYRYDYLVIGPSVVCII